MHFAHANFKKKACRLLKFAKKYAVPLITNLKATNLTINKLFAKHIISYITFVLGRKVTNWTVNSPKLGVARKRVPVK